MLPFPRMRRIPAHLSSAQFDNFHAVVRLRSFRRRTFRENDEITRKPVYRYPLLRIGVPVLRMIRLMDGKNT